MRPLFTVHGGEYLAGSEIERRFKHVNVWIPSRDTGVDLLVSDRENRRAVSFQVKFSKDYLVTHMRPLFQEHLRACGWWTISRKKLDKSPADFWIFLLLGFKSRSNDYVIVPKRELCRRLRSIHGTQMKIIQTYLWVTKSGRCWETRDLLKKEKIKIAEDKYREARRDFKKWLNNWSPVE